MPFLPEVPLDAAQTRAMARGLYTIARSDGLHPKEQALIRQFADGTGADTLMPITAEALAAALPTLEQRLLFMKLGLMLARVQGGVTPQERQVIGRFAQAMELTGADLLGLELQLVQELEQGLAQGLAA